MRRSQLLLLLLILLLIAAGYAWFATPRLRRVSPEASALDMAERQNSDLQTGSSLVADLDLSGGDKADFNPPAKNLFGPLYLPPPKPVVKPAVVRRPPPKKKEPPPPPPEKEIRIIQPVRQAPMPQVEVLGFLKKGGETTVFLSSRAGEIQLAKAGDPVGNDLVVERIDTTSVVVVRPSSGQRVALPLGEGRSQRLPTVRIQSGRPAFEPPVEPEPQAAPEQPADNTGVTDNNNRIILR